MAESAPARPWTQPAITIVVCALIGVCANLGTTWLLALRPPPVRETNTRWESIDMWPRPWPLARPSPHLNSVGRCWWATSELVVLEQPKKPPVVPAGVYRDFTPWSQPKRGPRQYGLSVGVPFRSLATWSSKDDRDTSEDLEILDEGRMTLNLPWVGRKDLPTLLVWPGFALNTLFYAVLAWGFWQVPLAIRRCRRRRAGRCARCGYDLVGLESGNPCPECGRARGV